jgi:transcriptional regulator with XRE-family HTH domain
MSYIIEDIAATFKAAREQKHLSQRALGEKVGLPQSHISKIESGSINIKLSSLIEIARVLDLEMKLVPRKAVPAVESIMRSTVTAGKKESLSRSLAEIRRTQEMIAGLGKQYPDLSGLARLHNDIRKLGQLPLGKLEPDKIRRALEPIKGLRRVVEETRRLHESFKGPTEVVKASRAASRAMQKLHDQLAYGNMAERPTLPAYHLDEEADDDA